MSKKFEFQSCQAVQVVQEGHARAGQAGRVVNTNNQEQDDAKPATFLVQFDADNAIEPIEGAALKILN